MNQEIKAKWIEALRSGKYSQGIGAMKTSHDTPNHCCLGVLCELHLEMNPGLSKWEIDRDLTGSKFMLYTVGVMSTKAFPQPIVYGWAGFEPEDTDNCAPYVSYNGKLQTLSNLNDNGVSFEQIADLIDTQL